MYVLRFDEGLDFHILEYVVHAVTSIVGRTPITIDEKTYNSWKSYNHSLEQHKYTKLKSVEQAAQLINEYSLNEYNHYRLVDLTNFKKYL